MVDNSIYVKQNLMKSVDRSSEVREYVKKWLYSFEGAITKKNFEHQMKRLDFVDDIAVSQLKKSEGRRTISLPPPPKNPPLIKPLMEQMVEDIYVAISGRGFRDIIKNINKQLKEFGDVYVLSVEKLILEFKSYQNKGSSPMMIEKAIETDFLIIVDLEIPITLEWHIREAIERIGRMREKDNKPIISTWNRFNNVNAFFTRFKIYDVKNYK